MTNPHEFLGGDDAEFDADFGDLFGADFDVSELSPENFGDPTEQTREAFDRALDRLPFHGDRRRTVEVRYAQEDDDGSRSVVGVQVAERFDKDGNPKWSNIGLQFYHGEDDLAVGAGNIRDLTDSQRTLAATSVEKLVQDLPEAEADWVKDAWHELEASDGQEDAEAAAAKRLLASSPHEIREYALEFADVKDSVGNDIKGDRVLANAAHLEDMAEAGLRIATAFVNYNGKDFEYSKTAGGAEQLFITDKRQQVRRETTGSAPEVTSLAEGVTFSVTGIPEFMKIIAASRAARAEAQELGLDRVTEGKLKEFTAAIEAIQANAQ